jgi:hypothetical protein
MTSKGIPGPAISLTIAQRFGRERLAKRNYADRQVAWTAR